MSSTANAMDAFVASNLIPFPFSSYFISNPSILKSNKFPPLSQRTTHPFHCRSCRYERVARTDSSRLDHVADSESLDRLVLRGAASAVGAAHGLDVAAAVLVAAAVQKSVIRIKILGEINTVPPSSDTVASIPFGMHRSRRLFFYFILSLSLFFFFFSFLTVTWHKTGVCDSVDKKTTRKGKSDLTCSPSS